VLFAAHARIVGDDASPVAYAVPETTPTVASAARASFVDRRNDLNLIRSPFLVTCLPEEDGTSGV